MVKAIIVDYSQEMIGYYKSILKSALPDIKVVAGLSESVEAKFFELLDSKAPGLVIIDIRFFALSSLRIIEKAIQKYPKMKMVVLGSYDDHDYMRAAMEKGAADYLYKPVKLREFELSLKRVLKIFEEARQREAEETLILAEYAKNTATFRDRFLANLLNGALVDEMEIAESMAYFNMQIKPPYTIFTLRIDRFKAIMADINEKQKHLLIYRVYFAVQKYLAKHGAGYVFINSFNSISCILGGVLELKELLDICGQIKEQVHAKTELSTTIGLGRSKDRLADVSISAKEAEAALRYRHLLGYNTIIPIEFAEPKNHITYRYPAKQEGLLVYTAVAGEYEYANKMFETIIDTLRESNNLPERILPKIIMNIVIAISRYASEQHMDIESKFRDFFDFSEILGITEIDEARSYMAKALKNFCGHIAQMRSFKADEIVDIIARHIRDRYYEDINLDNMALLHKTTPQYLNKIFEERLRMTVKDYLTSTRMNKAKEILKTQEADDDMVAAKIGYNDTRVFRSIFRRREGVFPSDYAKMQRK